MSANQMICHLSDTCRVSLGERRATAVGNPVAHTVIKWIVLYTVAPIPKGQPAAPELDQSGGGTAPTDFAADMRTLEGLLDRFAAGAGPSAAEHPFFGVLSRAEWGRFHQRHMHHHLLQFGV